MDFRRCRGRFSCPGRILLPKKMITFATIKSNRQLIRQYAGLVKFAHTIFAMPFALIGFVYALRTEGIPSHRAGTYGWAALLLQVLLCMVFARNAAMGFNRWGRPPHRSGQSPHGRPRNSGRKDQCPGQRSVSVIVTDAPAAVRRHRLDYQFTYRIIIACGTIRYIDRTV